MKYMGPCSHFFLKKTTIIFFKKSILILISSKSKWFNSIKIRRLPKLVEVNKIKSLDLSKMSSKKSYGLFIETRISRENLFKALRS